jgi:hypothetical protein
MSSAARARRPPPTRALRAASLFVTYIGALDRNPYDGHTLKDTLPGITVITGLEPTRAFVHHPTDPAT